MAMKWRRGLLLAGVNLVAALPLILMMESEDAQYLRDHSPGAKVVARVRCGGFIIVSSMR